METKEERNEEEEQKKKEGAKKKVKESTYKLGNSADLIATRSSSRCSSVAWSAANCFFPRRRGTGEREVAQIRKEK
jgi:hypothetical protein